MNIRKRFKFILQINGVLRFLLIKILYFNRFVTEGFCVFEKGSIINIGRNSSIILGKAAHLFPYTEIQSRGKITIGNSFSINKYSRVVAFQEIEIGNDVTIAQFVTIIDHDHNYIFDNNVMKLKGYNMSSVKIGNNVWIGDKSTILKGVSIGDNVVIGANTLINRNVPNNCLVAGNPFKILKTFNEN